MLTISPKLAALLIAMAVAFGAAWQLQTLRYAGQLARQTALQADELNNLTQAAQRNQQAEQEKRLATEKKLATSDQQRTRELFDAKRNQALLRDRLATADVRLSVLLEAKGPASDCNVSATSGTIGVVHAARRAQLDPAHAQRIIGITDAGDRGLIALRACQDYAEAVSKMK